MAIKETEYDPVTGVTRKFEYNDDGTVIVGQSKDIEPVKRRMYDKRKEDGHKYSNTGSDEHMNLYAELDYIHLHEAMRDGVDINDGAEMFKWVNRKHPELRASTKWHKDSRSKKGKMSGIIVR